MSEHDSGVDSEGETGSLPEPPMIQQHHGLNGSHLENNRVLNDEDMTNNGDEDDDALNNSFRALDPQDTADADQEVFFLSELSPGSVDRWRQFNESSSSSTNIDYNQPGTSRQCLSLNLSTSRDVCNAIDSLFKQTVLNGGSESSSSNDGVGEPGPFRMRTVSVSEMDNNGTVESTASTITNVSLNGFDFSINQTDPNTLWELYDQKNHRVSNQQNCPLISRYKILNNRRRNRSNTSQSTHKDRLLRLAVNQGSIQQVRQQISSGANVNATDGNLRTALHTAIVGGSLEIARLLLSNGADPNVKDMTGNTPLHLAVCSSKLDMVSTLLEHGASCISQDNNGRSPVQLARSKLSFLSRSIGTKTSADFKSKMNHSSTSPAAVVKSLLDSSLEEIKMEVMKISIMLGKCLEKLHSERTRLTAFCNSTRNFSNGQTTGSTSLIPSSSSSKSIADPIGQIETFRDRVQASQSTVEVEKDVNDLLKSLEHWAL